MRIGDDILDLRDVVERMRELHDELSEESELSEDDFTELKEWSDLALQIIDKKRDEVTLEETIDELEGAAENDEPTLINENYFSDYVREEFEDAHPDVDLSEWPFDNINWDNAADDVRSDYTSYSVKGWPKYAGYIPTHYYLRREY